MLRVARRQRQARIVPLVWLLLVAAWSGSDPVLAQDIEPQASSLLKAATSYLAGQDRFTLDTQSTIEVVLHSGQKIQYDLGAKLSIQRPDKLRAERVGELVDQEFYYDGKSLTLYNPDQEYYATENAPSTVEEMLDFARESLDIIAPAGDFVYKNAYDVLMEDVVSGFVVGKSVIGEVRCDHLAFRNPGTDWQVWIQEGSEPLVKKLVITSNDIPGSPQFTVVITDWNLSPKFSSDFFEFVAPGDATRIDFQRVD